MIKAEGRRQKAEMVAAICFLIAGISFAQDRYTPMSTLPLGDSLLTLPTSHIPAQGAWEVKFTHRFNESIDGNDRLHSLFGLDSNADVVFGFSYAPRRALQLSLARSNTNDTLEGAIKYVVLQQAQAVPASIALRIGGDYRSEKNLGDRSSLFAQVILSRQLGRKAELFLEPTYVTNAGRAVAGTESLALFDDAFNVPIGFAFRIKPALSVIAELIPPNRDLPDNVDAEIGWALGLKRAIGGHYFEILLTNSNGSTVDQYVTSTYQGSPFNSGDIHLGFNIERRFGRRPRH